MKEVPTRHSGSGSVIRFWNRFSQCVKKQMIKTINFEEEST